MQNRDRILDKVTGLFKYTINDPDFVICIDESGVYLFNSFVNKETEELALNVLEELGLEKNEGVLISVSFGVNREYSIGDFVSYCHVERLNDAIIELVDVRDSFLGQSDINEILDCYCEDDSEELTEEQKKQNRQKVLYNYKDSILYKKLVKYNNEKEKEIGYKPMTEDKLLEIVEKRYDTITQLQDAGIEQDFLLDISSIVTVAPAFTPKVIIDPKNGWKDSTVLFDSARQKAITSALLCLVALGLLYLNTYFKIYWWMVLIVDVYAIYYAKISNRIYRHVLGQVTFLGAITVTIVTLIDPIKQMLLWFSSLG